MPNFKKALVEGNTDVCKVVHYIHANPVHHGFVKTLDNWKFSSYKAYLFRSPTKIDRDFVLDIFGGMAAFIQCHQQRVDLKIKVPGV